MGGRVQWIGRQRIELDGMKNHKLVQAALPCGWSDYVFIHKQASLQATNLEEPFYLLDEGTGQGYVAWWVLPAVEEWQRVVQTGLASDAIAF